MADIDFDDYGDVPRIGARQVQRMARIGGLLASVAMVAGAVVWGYRLAVRDVSGIPLIHAPETAMRIAPDNPGGSVADHQGMAINAIAAIGNAEDLPDEIVLAPTPEGLTEEDGAGLTALPDAYAALVAVPHGPGPMPLEAASLAPVEVAPADLPQAAAPMADGAPDTSLIAMTPDATDDAIAMALAEALSLDDGSIETVAPEADDPVAGDALVAQSIRPKARPANLLVGQGEVTEATPVLASLPGLNEIDPATLASGTRLVQLGAYDTPDLARDEWRKLLAQFGDLMTSKALVIEAAQSGGSTFYRLRAHGFVGEDDVRRFCAALVAEDAACIPATVR